MLEETAIPPLVSEGSTAGWVEERHRQQMVDLVFVIYWLVIFSGVLRKWIFPGLANLLYFAEDPFILVAYALALRYGYFPRNDPLFKTSCLVFTVFVLLAAFQVALIQANPLTTIYGLRTYFWCVPLAFIIGETFRGKDLARLIRQTMLVCIPIAILVFLQFKSPPDSWLNRYVVAEHDPALVGEVVRTCGTFSYITGQEIFVASTLPLLLSFWLLPRRHRPLRLLIGSIASLAILTNFMLNGSRGILFFAASSILAGIVSCLVLLKRDSLAGLSLKLLAIPLICLSTAFVMSNFFPTALQYQAERLTGEGSLETELIARATLPYTEWLANSLQSSPAFGYGLGAGTVGGAFLSTGQRSLSLNENEWPRIIAEVGLFGLLYISLRILFIIVLLVSAIRATRRSTNPVPLLLLSFTALLLFSQPITLGGETMYFCWLFAGFGLAAKNIGVPGPVSSVAQIA